MVSLARDLRWWTAGDDEDTARAVTAAIEAIQGQQAHRTERLQRAARLYGDIRALGLASAFPITAGLEQGLALNLTRCLAQTALADLVSGPPPRPFFATQGGHRETQKRAQSLTKFVSGVFYEVDFDALARKVALHSAVFGEGVVKICSEEGEARIDLVFPWEVHVDERDAIYGQPRCLYQTRWVDRAVLQELFPAHAEVIADAQAPSPLESSISLGRDALSDQLLVTEAWRLPSSKRRKESDGRHVIALNDVLLHDEVWSQASFPFARLSWTTQPGGFWSQGIAEEVAGLQIEVNAALLKVREQLALAATRVYLARGSKIHASQVDNANGSIVYYDGRPPIFDVARTVDPQLYDYIDRLWGKAFATTGISEVHAAAMRPAGLESGVSQRVYAEQRSARLSAWHKNFLDFYLEVSRQVVRLMERLAEDDDSVDVVYHDARSKQIERIAWEDCALDESEFVLQAYPVSGLASSVAGRMQDVQDLVNAGIIDSQEGRRLLGMPDLEEHDSLQNAPRELVESLVDSFLDGGEYVPPDAYMDLSYAMRYGILALCRARMSGVDEERLALVRRFLEETQLALQPPPPPPGPEAGPGEMDPEMMPPDAGGEQISPEMVGPEAPMELALWIRLRARLRPPPLPLMRHFPPRL